MPLVLVCRTCEALSGKYARCCSLVVKPAKLYLWAAHYDTQHKHLKWLCIHVWESIGNSVSKICLKHTSHETARQRKWKTVTVKVNKISEKTSLTFFCWLLDCIERFLFVSLVYLPDSGWDGPVSCYHRRSKPLTNGSKISK